MSTRPLPHRLPRSLLVLIGALALARVTVGGAATGAVLGTAAVGALVAALTVTRGHRVAALAAGMAAVAVVALFSAMAVVAGGAGHLPTAGNLRTVWHSLQAGGVPHFPVSPGPGLVLVAALVAGGMAVATFVLPGGSAALPAAALATWSTVVLPSPSAAVLAVAAVGAGCWLVLDPARTLPGWATLGGAVGAGALCVLALIPATSGANGGPAGGGAHGGPAVAAVPPTALSLVTDLRGLEIHDPRLSLFTATTPVATYWQVAALTVLQPDDVWVPDAATDALLTGHGPATAGGAVATGPPGPRFTASVTVAHFSSRLLPAPPGTVAVPGATVSAAGVVLPALSVAGQSYRATAPVPRAVPADVTADPLARYLALPPLPPGIVTLARSLTASATTPLARAEALTDWFRSGAFHYSLTAPAPSLVAFLTTAHTGSCQQFAGAFAVLARSVGLPTRVAVGFTTGVRRPDGTTVVRGIDAHAWPQVLLGGQWVSFEPTPEQPSGELAPAGVLGPAAQGTPNPVGPPTLPRGLHGHLPQSAPPPAAPVTGAGLPGWAVGLVVLLPLALAGGLVALALRRRRRRRRPPAQRVAAAWRRTERALARHHLARPRWRTPAAHAADVAARTAGGEGAAFAREVATVAGIVERAAYGAAPLSDDDARTAEDAAQRAERAPRRAVAVGR